MSDYIKREEAIMAVTRAKLPDVTQDGVPIANGKRSVTDCVRRLKEIPAADVRPVVRGKWMHTTQPLGWRDEDCAECSVCGVDFVLDEWAMDDFKNLMNYCPNCGADMRNLQSDSGNANNFDVIANKEES